MTPGETSHVSNAEILVVEDNTASLKMLTDLLTEAGYRVRPASDGELGLRSVQAKQPDLILLDFKLPGMDGVEVCRHLKENPKTCDIPVIFISALGDSELKVKSLDAGAIDYVTKPIVDSEVLARINTHLNIYRMQRKLTAQTEELTAEISQRKRTEEALRASEGKLSAFKEAATEGFVVYDANLNLDSINKTALELFPSGSSEENLKGKHALEIAPSLKGTVRYDAYVKILKTGEPVYFDDVVPDSRFGDRHLSVHAFKAGDGLGVIFSDITERKRAEREHLRAIADYTYDWESWLAPDGQLKWLNPAVERVTGFSVADCQGMDDYPLPFVHEEDRADVAELLRQSLAEKSSLNDYRFRINLKAGPVRWMAISWQAIYDEQGAYLGLRLSVRDITKRKQAEEERNRILTLSSDLICTAGTDGYFKFLNPAWENALGYSHEELLARPFLDFIHPDDHRMTDSEVVGLAAGAEILDFENRYICKDGSIRAISWRATFLPEDRVIYGIGRDITKRKQAEEAHERARKFMQTVIDGFPEALTVINRDYTITLANRTVCEMSGGQDPVAAGLKCHQVSHGRETPCEGNEHPCPLKQVCEAKVPVTVEHVHNDAQGREIVLEIISAPIFGEDGEVVQVIESARDITERKRHEEQIAASLKEKEVLLREIHHRVKNNMQVIVSLLRLHAKRSRSEQMQSIFDDCRDRINAMSLVHEALYESEELARIDFGSYLTKLCRNLCKAHGISKKGIVVTVEQDAVLLGMEQGIAVGMVVCELISNAFKHGFPAGKPGTVSVGLSAADNEQVELTVQDDGVGLPEEVDILNSPSLGLKLAAAAVTRELGGSFEVERSGGTRYTIRFKGNGA